MLEKVTTEFILYLIYNKNTIFQDINYAKPVYIITMSDIQFLPSKLVVLGQNKLHRSSKVWLHKTTQESTWQKRFKPTSTFFVVVFFGAILKMSED